MGEKNIMASQGECANSTKAPPKIEPESQELVIGTS